MSSACSLPSSPSSTTCKQSASTAEADLFTKHSPRSASHYRRPSPSKPGSKWRAVLAHLAPLRLSLSAPAKPRKPSISSPSRSIEAVPPANNNLLALCDSLPFSSDAANDVEELLHIFRKTPSLDDDMNKRTLALGALCALCVASPNNTNRCVRAGGVELIIDTLNGAARRSNPLPPASAVVEETEKALLLLQLLVTVSSSEEGCIAALRAHPSSIIPTLNKKLLRVSESCTTSAIAILTALCHLPDAAFFRKAVAETSIPSKLVVVLQVATNDSTKRRAGRLLRLLAEPQDQVHTNDAQEEVTVAASIERL